MFLFSPYFWLAIAGVFVVGYIGGCTHEKAQYDDLKQSWELDKRNRLKAAQDESAAREAVKQLESTRLAGEFKALDDQRVAIAARNKDLDTRLARLRADQQLVDSLRNSISAANASTAKGAAGGPEANPAPGPGDREGYTSSEAAIRQWGDKMIWLYEQCRVQVIGWNRFWDEQAAVE